jgi:hypothetical protein
MKYVLHSVTLLAVLAVLMLCEAAFAEEVGTDQLKQMMAESADNLTTYTYSRTGDASILYSNNSLNEEFSAVKTTLGKVDLVNQAGWWGSKLMDLTTGDVLTWEGYFINGSEYWKEDQNWTEFIVNDSAQIIEDYNELPGEVNLINYSNMQIVGNESLNGVEYYKLVGSPIEPVYKGMIGLQLLAAYFPSPFPLPEEIQNRTLDVNDQELLNNSSIVLTAWVSKEDSLLRRLDINSSLVVTPEILNITSPDFRIESTMNESTTYMDFGSPVEIVLPEEALQNKTFRTKGADWRWAVFGSVRP